MPNKSTPDKSKGNRKSTSSGHGSLGMGGQPNDDPRDLAGGGEGRAHDDRGGRTGPVGGASGNPAGASTGGGPAGNETVGPGGDKGITGNLGT